MESDISYLKTKEFIYKKLQDVNGVLPQNKIELEVTNTKKLIATIGLKVFAQVLSTDSILPLKENDWVCMERELETHFDVQMEKGILIQGDEQQQRDNAWWTSKEKQKNSMYYWSKYKEFMKKDFPPEVVKAVDTDTDIVMDNIEDPSLDKFSRYGMVVGHVQSGKTANYSALVCKAADAGYKFIVIIAGGINNLRNQTQVRLNESFVGFDKGVPIGVGKLGNIKKELLPISLTTAEQDFNKQDANKNSQGLNFDNINSPILLVIKKNTSTLTNVINWLQAQYKYQIATHSMLLIDDESDYASINTKDQDDPTTINKKLRKLLSLFHKSAYVAYTATPYANIFIDHEAGNDDVGRDLFPKDFIYALEAPSNYFGARKIFLESNKKHIIEIDDYLDCIPEKHKKDYELPSIPESLYEAMRIFILNIGIRYLRNQGDKHNSMLIHATRFTMVHKRLSIHVEEYIADIRKDVNAFGRMKDPCTQSDIIKSIKQSYELRFADLEYEWEILLGAICTIIDTIVIREVHQSTVISLEYRNDRPTNAIVIGGTSLSRGYTLEGLSVSYFLRNTVFYDTLMQMGRWFGYRNGYEDLCRIYMSNSMSKNFAFIIEASDDLIDNFKRMSAAKMTPNDFGLSVKYHPDSGLQVTARNKQKNSKDIYFEMKLDGHAKETSWLINDIATKKENLKAIEWAIKRLIISKNTYRKVLNSHLWEDVNKELVIEFLNKFQVYSSDPFGLKSRMPINFVKQYVSEVSTPWDIALYSGESNEPPYNIEGISIKREKRKIKMPFNERYYEIKNRQVSSGSAESIALPKHERDNLKSTRKDIREKMRKPLLMLHILDVEGIDKELAAFGISFPGGVSSTNKTVKLKINSVYIQGLLDEADYDD